MHLARSILIAFGLLALSATVVIAAKPAEMPEAAAKGLQTAWEKSGNPVPMAPADAGNADAGDADAESEDADDVDELDNEPAEHPDNHGAAVSAAAQSETPEDTNHGAFVSSVARDNAGQATAAERSEARSENGAANGNRP